MDPCSRLLPLPVRALGFALLAVLALVPPLGAQATLPTITTPPALVPNANPNVPLSASITLQTDVPTKISLLVDDGSRTFLIPDAEPEFRTDHSVPVLGLFPGTTNSITVIAIDQDDEQTPAASPVVFVTPALPATFPPITVNSLDTSQTEPGYTIFAPRSTTPGGGPATFWSIIIDGEGRVVWYLDGQNGAEQSSAGNIIVAGVRNKSVIEIDLLGNVVDEYYASALDGGAGASPGAVLIDTDSLHHEFIEMPEGADSDFLMLSSEARVYSDYPADESDLSVTSPMETVVGDVIVELTSDGTIVRQKCTLDILDPYRIVYDGLTGAYWNSVYGANSRDWTHANAVIYDPRDDTYIVSLRHQDCIAKIRRSTPGTGSPDDLVWILGDPAGWRAPWRDKLLTPMGPRFAVNRQGRAAQINELEFEFPFHQHAVQIHPNGNILCFDNGNYRVLPPETAAPQDTYYSRAVEYRVHPKSMSVEQIWAAGGKYDTDPYRLGYSWFVSNTDPLPLTGNYLVNGGGTRDFASGTYYIRLQELTRTLPPTSVLDITVRQPMDALNWNAYRAHRIPDIYSRAIPTDELLLTVGPVVAGQEIELMVAGDALPGETVWFAFSETGKDASNCYFNGSLCLELRAPVCMIGNAVVGRDGRATITVPPDPNGMPTLQPIYVQAAIVRGSQSVASNVITTIVN